MENLLYFLHLLDGRTLFVACALVAGAFTLVMLANLCLRKTYPGYDRWAWAEFSFALLFIFLAMRDQISGSVLITSVNLFACSSAIMLAEGMYKFTDRPMRRAPVCALSAFYLFLSGYSFYANYDSRIRTALLCTYMGLLAVYAALPLLGKPPNGRAFGYRFTAAVLLFNLLNNVTHILSQTESIKSKAASWQPMDIAFFLGNLLLIIGITFSFFILTNERAEADLRDANQALEAEVEERRKTEFELRSEVEKRKSLEHQLKKLTKTDELTHVLNRRGLLEAIKLEVHRASRLHHPLTVLLIDVDHFKQINDTHGHAAGDQVLITFAETCLKRLRVIDTMGRFGGDEFAVILPETSIDQALQVADKLRAAVESSETLCGDLHIHSTISVGIADRRKDDFTGIETLVEADRALYLAKHAGRNCVRTVHSQDEADASQPEESRLS